MFNNKIKLFDIDVGSLILVDFGESKNLFREKMHRNLKEDCFSIQDCPNGLNLNHEFSYIHMAIMLSNKLNKVVAVVPLTEFKERDNEYHDVNIILNVGDFGLPLIKKTTIKLDQLRFIDRARVIKVEKQRISKSLLKLIKTRLVHSFLL